PYDERLSALQWYPMCNRPSVPACHQLVVGVMFPGDPAAVHPGGPGRAAPSLLLHTHVSLRQGNHAHRKHLEPVAYLNHCRRAPSAAHVHHKGGSLGFECNQAATTPMLS